MKWGTDRLHWPGAAPVFLAACVFSALINRSRCWIRWWWRECQQRRVNVCRGLSSKPWRRGWRQRGDRYKQPEHTWHRHGCRWFTSIVVCLCSEQETLVSELKCWCLAQLYNMEVRLTGEPSGTEVPHSSSAAEGVDEDEGAGLTLLPFSQAAQRLDLHGHLGQGEPSTTETGAANHYFVVHVESSPGNHIHLNTFLSCKDGNRLTPTTSSFSLGTFFSPPASKNKACKTPKCWQLLFGWMKNQV